MFRKLNSHFRYSPESVFDTFPWPKFAVGPDCQSGRGVLQQKYARPAGSGTWPTACGQADAIVGPEPSPGAEDTRAETRPSTIGTAAWLKPVDATSGGAHLNDVLPAEAVAKIAAVAAAGREVRRVREVALSQIKGGLRAVYRTLALPGANPLKDAHAALDAAVLAAYGFDAKKDLLAQLLALNQTVAARLERHEPVTAPGLPLSYPCPQTLVSDDCIRPVAG